MHIQLFINKIIFLIINFDTSRAGRLMGLGTILNPGVDDVFHIDGWLCSDHIEP